MGMSKTCDLCFCLLDSMEIVVNLLCAPLIPVDEWKKDICGDIGAANIVICSCLPLLHYARQHAGPAGRNLTDLNLPVLRANYVCSENSQEVDSLPLWDEKSRKQGKRIFGWKPSWFRREIALQTEKDSPYTSRERMRKQRKTGFFIPTDRISCVSFLAKNEVRPVKISSKRLKMAQLVRSQHCLLNWSEKCGKKIDPRWVIEKKNRKKFSRIGNYRLLYGTRLAS